MAKAGVYNLPILHDRAVLPLITHWNIESLTGMSPAASELQHKIMGLPAQILREEIFEKRVGISYA